MSVSGLCGVCERAEARHTCRTCGRVVCNDHWNESLAACTPCAEGLGSPDDPADPSARDDPPDGFRID